MKRVATIENIKKIRREFSEIFATKDASRVFVVVRKTRDHFRLGEFAGDWLMSGTAADVLSRMEREGAVYRG